MSTFTLGLRRLVRSVAAAALAIAVGILCISISGFPAAESAQSLLVGAVGSTQAWGATLNEVVPLVLIGLAWIVAIRAARINIGFQGQMLAGAICATFTGTHVATGVGHVGLAIAVVAAAAGGAVLAGIAAGLAQWRGVPEIISTLLLNFIMVQVVAWLIRGPMMQPGQELPQSSSVDAGAVWPTLLSGTPLHYDILLAVGLAILVAWAFKSTRAGWRVRMTGDNAEAAQHAGIATSRVGIGAMLVSGALSGIAGGSLVLSSLLGNLVEGIDGGFGLVGIAVALLAGNSALACIPAAVLLAGLHQGGALMETTSGVPPTLVGIIQGLVIIAVAVAANIQTGVLSKTWLVLRQSLTNAAGIRAPRGAAE